MFGVRTRQYQRFVHTEVVLAALFFVGSARGQWPAPPGVTAAFDLQSPSVTLHEPVAIEFSLRNQSAEVVTIDLGYGREGNFQFEIIQPDGSTFSPPPLPRHEGITRLPELSIPAGETYRQKLILNKWCPFSKPGDYRIGVTLRSVIRRGPGAHSEIVFSQELALRIGERDPKHLNEVCANLAKDGMSSNAQTALDAVGLLSYVQDVIAVPYLARLCREGPLVAITKSIALDGLMRIAKAEGPKNVISHLGPKDREQERQLRAWFGSSPP